ncbi:MAG: dipeptide/oligopeptide/nickel ABC transporter permease/ATP-binding protein [Treponema sp.]
MKRFFDYLKTRPLSFASVIFLSILYFVMIFAEFFAPYPASLSFENNTFHPANIQLTARGIKVREHRVIDRAVWKYARVKDEQCIHRLVWFAKGSEYKLFGLFPCRRHLFGSSSDYPAYLLGADNLGRDLFSRIVYGSRISLTIGFVATAASLFLAVLLGGIAGYAGGGTDWSIMRLAEFFMHIPGLYFILFLRSLLNARMDSGTSYMIITLILALVGWPGSARTIRGLVHSIKREEFVLDADIEGVPVPVIIFRHIIPQTASLLIVSTALSVPGFIMSETTLSYLGLGISDPAVSWGSLINRDISTLSNLRNYPWLLIPVLALLAVTLGFNFLGDTLRDFFDPYNAVFSKRTLLDFIKKNSALVKGGLNTDLAGNSKIPSSETTENAPSAENILLSVKDLSVTFCILKGTRRETVHAVQGISFDVMKGEILGLVGESGSGKSVSTAAIPGLLSANAWQDGRIFYEGVELTALNRRELMKYRGAQIALIFQEPGRSFDPLQNIGSVFWEAFRVTEPAISKEEAYARAEKLLQEVGLPDPRGRLSAYPHQFSGGQLQRIGIALALAQNCRLLIADEPTTALDVTIQAQIISLLLRLKQERGLSIIFISHDIDLVAQISDRIAVMRHGKIVETGSAAQIMTTPRHEYTKALISAVPKFGEHYSDAEKA